MSRRRRNKNEPLITLVLVMCVGLVLTGGSIIRIKSLDELIYPLLFAIILCAIAMLLTWEYLRSQRIKSLHAVTMNQVHRMSGVEFEQFIGRLLEAQGYQIRYTAASGDFGIDLIASRGNEKIAIQAKRYKNAVGQEAVREAIAGMTHYKCTSATVVTNSSYTNFAKQLAKSNNCVLIDGELLGKWILDTQRK